MPLDLFVAKKELIKNHREPKVLTLDEDTKVVNKKNTSNRHPNGNFGNFFMALIQKMPRKHIMGGKLMALM